MREGPVEIRHRETRKDQTQERYQQKSVRQGERDQERPDRDRDQKKSDREREARNDQTEIETSSRRLPPPR